jgi:hypothetical protein
LFFEFLPVNHFAVPILYVKLCFVAGPKYHHRVSALLEQIQAYPEVATKAVKALTTHWAYYYFLQRLTVLEVSPMMHVPQDKSPKPLYFVGDSHVLSAAWMELRVRGETHYIHPLLITGLKAWHLRPGHQFLTVSNTHECFKALPRNIKEIVSPHTPSPPPKTPAKTP